MSEPAAPLIIIGMHRSGTSLLTRVLQDAGLFMGLGATRNEEAAFTNALNAWLFRQASATWDRPESIDDLLADETLAPWLIDYLHGIANGPSSMRFLGFRRWLRYRGLHALPGPWGWKDPRNTWTLPLWLRLFPNARVLHIVRHGVDVAESLRVRRAHVLADRTTRYQRHRRLYLANPLAPKRRGFGPQVRCRNLAGGFDLWELYVSRARAHVRELGPRALEIRYEDLLAEPLPMLEQALAFSGCTVTDAGLRAAAARVNASRAMAWQQDSRLEAYAHRVDARLQACGYQGTR